MFATNCAAERNITPDTDRATLFIDNGASNTFLDTQSIRGLRDKVREFKDLEKPKSIETAGNQTQYGTKGTSLGISAFGLGWGRG